MQKKIILLLTISFLFTFVLFASTTGKLAGKVRDQDGNPIPFANVVLIGIEIGAQTNDKGQFMIINIPPGEYDIQISRGGYQPARIEGLRINLDETTIQNVTLSKAAIELEKVSVTAARNELVSKSNTSSGITMSEEAIENISVDNIEGIVAIQAGASVVDGELHVRGGRPNEVVFSVDGMSVSDPVDGGAALTIDTDAIKDMKVMTGGFPAEFGNAQSGIVNIITKDGGREYSGKIETSSDHLIENADNSNSDVVKFSLGGPVLGILAPKLRDKFTFFFNGAANWHDSRYKDYYDDSPNEDISTIISSWSDFESYDPYKNRDNIFGIFDTGDRNYNSYNANLKMKYIFNPKTNITFALRGDDYLRLPFSHTWKYALEHFAETEGTQRQYITTFAHVFNPQMNIKVKASLYEKTIEQGPRGITRDMYFVKDSTSFELLASNTPGASTGIIYLAESNGDGVIGEYQDFNWAYETNDGNMETIPFVRPGTIWGSYFDDNNQELALKTDFEYQINQIHGFKTGFEFKKHHIEKDRVLNPWNVNVTRYNNYLKNIDPEVSYSAGDTIIVGQSVIVLTEDKDFYDLDDIYDATIAASGIVDGYKADPLQGAFYLQDKMEWEGMIVNAGLRFDIWYLGGDYDIVTANYTGSYLQSINPDSKLNQDYYIPDADPVTDPENYAKYQSAKKYYKTIKDKFETPEIMVSPRLGISHPISEKAVLHFAYNYQRQLPQMQYVFTTGRPQDVIENPGAAIIIGNPELEAQSTITYEAGLQYQLGEDYVLDITTYYKNIYNYVSTKEVIDSLDATLKWDEYISEDYGSARGVDVNLQKLLSNFITGSASYSMTWANGNHSETNAANEESLREFPLNWDIRNSFNLSLTFQIAKGEEFYIPFTDVVLPIDDFTTNFSYDISSGKPYTVADEEGNLSKESNTKRQPHTETANLTIRKNFTFSGRKRLSVYLTIDNLFNRRNVYSVYPITGSPYYSGQDLDTNNDGYVAPETTAIYNMYDKNPANYSSGRGYNFGISYRW